MAGRPCGLPASSGIDPGFPGVSRCGGQVGHVLLTRSPLYIHRSGLSVRLACVKHAASVHPEPGSNSPFEYGAGTAALPGKPDSALPRSWRPHRGGRRAAGRSIVVIKATSMTHRISSKNSVFRSIRFSRSRLRPGGASAAPHSRAAQEITLLASVLAVKNFF